MKVPFAFVFLLAITGCNFQNTSALTKKDSTFDYEAHRGGRGLMPENTIPAMLHAIDLNVSTLEMDLYLTADSQVVVSHEPWFNPETTTKPDGSMLDSGDTRFVLYKMPYDSIRKFDVGLRPYAKFLRQRKIQAYKPLLSDLIDSVERYCHRSGHRVNYNMEIKSTPEGDDLYHPKPKEFVDLVMKVLKEKEIEEEVIIQSFDIRPLKYLHGAYPGTRTSYLIAAPNKNTPDELIAALGFTPTIISPEYLLVTTGFVDACHSKNIQVIPWTVNELSEINRLKSLKVDGIISDYPDLFTGSGKKE